MAQPALSRAGRARVPLQVDSKAARSHRLDARPRSRLLADLGAGGTAQQMGGMDGSSGQGYPGLSGGAALSGGKPMPSY